MDYFKTSEHLNKIVKSDKSNEKLCSSFKLLIENLYPNQDQQKKAYYQPYDFKDKISRMNPLFEGITAADARDMINFLLMTLHDELNKPNKLFKPFNYNQKDQTNKTLMFNNFVNYFKNYYCSIIIDLFYEFNSIATECINCKVVTYYYQIYYYMFFPFEEIRKFKLSHLSGSINNNINYNTVNIYDCFEYDRKTELCVDENARYCGYCKKVCEAEMRTCLISSSIRYT